jgi:hypothetical protein
MVPAPYITFLLASAGASAALVGLLFVAISVAPDRVFGRKAVAQHQTEALSAFTALVNAFLISLGGLDPGINIGTLALVMGLLALSQTLALLRLWPSWRHEQRMVRGLILFVVSAGAYGYEIWTAQYLIRTPKDTNALDTLLGLLLGAYAIGLVRAWELLGGPGWLGLTGALGAVLRPPTAGDGAHSTVSAPASGPADAPEESSSTDESTHGPEQSN